VVVAFLAAIVVIILLRTVRRDLARYEDELGGAESGTDELAGWKLVAGDVFWQPARPLLLCVLVGDGVRILVMGVVSWLPSSSPRSGSCRPRPGARRPVRIGKSLEDGAARGRGRVVVRGVGRRARVPLRRACRLHHSQLRALVQRQHGGRALRAICARHPPLVLCIRAADARRRASRVPRPARRVPRQAQQGRSPGAGAAGAMVLAVAVRRGGFIELFFIMSSLWLGRVYYIFGFLLVVLTLLVAVCTEVSVVLTYMGLCVEDWRWWWRAFLASGSVALYVLVYAVYYLAGPVSAALYVGYSLLMALAVMLATGTVGLGASFCFVHYLFSTVKLPLITSCCDSASRCNAALCSVVTKLPFYIGYLLFLS
jgi:transmembrane 9 superfamily member 2/4